LKRLILVGLFAIPGCKTDCRIESQTEPEIAAEAPDPFMLEYDRLRAERSARYQKLSAYDKRSHSDQGPFQKERQGLMARFRIECGLQSGSDPRKSLLALRTRRNSFQKRIEAFTSQENLTDQMERDLDDLQSLAAKIDYESQHLMRSLKAEITRMNSYFHDWDELDRKERELRK
jgi:hypothetical protein